MTDKPVAWLHGVEVFVRQGDVIRGLLPNPEMGISYSSPAIPPVGAVPLVPATDVDEASAGVDAIVDRMNRQVDETRTIAAWLVAEAKYWEVQARSEFDDVVCEQSEMQCALQAAFGDGYDEFDITPWMVEEQLMRRKDTPQLPALDAPEALRYAAQVAKNHSDRREVGAARTRSLEVAAALRDDADCLEAAARADAERDARIEALTDVAVAAVQNLVDLLAPGKIVVSRDELRDVVESTLEDLNPTQAK